METVDRSTLSPIDNARLTLSNAAKYLIDGKKIKPWITPNSLAYDAPGTEAFKLLCTAIVHTYTRCLVCGTDQRAVDWTPCAKCEFCSAPLCDHCYEDHWRDCEVTHAK